MLKNKDILFVAATHGDEKIGVEILKKINKKLDFNWLIANKKAFSRNKRFIDVDLNRIMPGKKYSRYYEKKRAYELNKILKNYKYIIDIHETVSNTGIFTIITKPTKKNMRLANSLPINNIVIWESGKKRNCGPITEYVNCGLEIECGPKNSKKIKKELENIIIKILKKYKNENKKNIFEVYGNLKKKNIQTKKIKDFKKTTINGETFYPLLVGQYSDKLCYKMKKINNP